MVGQNVGKYKVLDRIGRGGMGTVYRALDETLHREVAIKVLNAELGEPEVAKRFRAEAITVARLNHPGIATIYELLHHDGQWLMVMEFVRGETLEHMVERMGPLSPQRAAELCMQALAALAHAHSLGVIHRDLKPANLMITESGAVKIMDFGIARVAGAEHLTSAGYMMGTPAYMAPEQVLGLEIDARADLYSMGVVYYRLMTGRLPFKGDTPFAMAQSQVNDPPTPAGMLRSDLPPWVEQLMAKALAKSPGERFQSAIELHEAFARCLAGLPLSSMYSSTAQTELLLTPPRALPSGAFSPRPPTGAQPYPGQATLSAAPTVISGPVAVAPTTPKAPTNAKQTNITIAVLATVVVILAVVVGIVMFRPDKPSETALPSADATVPPPAPTLPLQVGQGATAPAPGAAQPAATPPPAVVTPPPSPVTPPPGAPVGATNAASGSTVPATPGLGAPAKPPARGTTATTPGAAPGTSVAPGAAAGAGAAVGVAATGAPISAPVADAHVTFPNLKILVVNGRRAQDQDAILTFVGGQVSVSPRAGGSAIASIPYKGIARATYVRAKDPKWDPALSAPPDGLDMPGGLFGRPTRHWLTIQTNAAFMILRLEDSNWARIIDTIEARAGIKVER